MLFFDLRRLISNKHDINIQIQKCKCNSIVCTFPGDVSHLNSTCFSCRSIRKANPQVKFLTLLMGDHGVTNDRRISNLKTFKGLLGILGMGWFSTRLWVVWDGLIFPSIENLSLRLRMSLDIFVSGCCFRDPECSIFHFLWGWFVVLNKLAFV